MDTDEFDIQEKSGVVFLDIDNFYTLILADNVVLNLSFIIIYGYFLKYLAVTLQ